MTELDSLTVLVLGFYAIVTLTLLYGVTLWSFATALFRLTIGNRLAAAESRKHFRQGSFLNTRHGMVIDPETGLVHASDSLIVTGKKTVFFPFAIGCACVLLMYHMNLPPFH